ncbi:MAG: hypothetical protein J7642_16750 [Cyanobacteria bacterium SBC]|nr:hypothetical protein [Cyanobacteria bacterium SBC]
MAFERDLKFIIFAQARTGSTTLQQLLSVHPKLKCCHEPFNPGKAGISLDRKYLNSSELQDLESKQTRKGWHWTANYPISVLQKVLEDIRQNSNVIKHLDNFLPSEMNRYLLLNCGYKVVFLYRKNILKQGISRFISKTSQVWGTDKEKVKATSYHLVDN